MILTPPASARLASAAARRFCLGALLLLAGLAGAGALAQTSFFVVLTNGASSNRVNWLVLSEGYTASQTALFRADATNAVNSLLNREPFASYRRHFNAFGVFVPSAQSGADHPSQGTYADTWFNSTYDSYGSTGFLTIPPNSYDSDSSHGQGRVDALVQQYLPGAHLVLLLVNDLLAGGSGGRTLVVSRSTAAQSIIAHESGHTLARLGDEYDDPYPGYPDVEEPNTTRETRPGFIKWRAWIDPETPLPTPANLGYSDVTGLFEGAHYHAAGWYRPALNCMMRTAGQPFCPVCSETLVKCFHERARPIDSVAPAASVLSRTNAAPVVFSLQLLRPVTPALLVRWFTNDVQAPGASASFTFTPPAPGAYAVRAEVSDPTALVRSDPDALLRQTAAWRLAWPGLSLSAPGFLPGGRFSFTVAGLAPCGWQVEGSTNLATWLVLGAGSLTNGQAVFAEPAAGRPWRFYRAASLPAP